MGVRTIPGVCKQCVGPFAGRRGAKFCSRSCFNAWMPGNLNRAPKSIEHRRRIADSQRGKLKGPQTDEHRNRISLAKRGKSFSELHRRALSEAKVRQMQLGGFVGRQTAYISSKNDYVQHAHSSYELRRMKFLDASPLVRSWTKRHGITIPYEFDGRVKLYVPDFLVEWVSGKRTLEEVKGWIRDPDRVAAKTRAAGEFANANGLTYMFLRNGDLEHSCQD